MHASRPTTLASHGMIATPHYLATSAGLRVLEEGGSAMDAAICASAMLTVLYPDQTAIGGDCLFMAYDAATGVTHGYNGSGPAPRLADPQALLDDGWSAMPNKGPFAITVPGTIDAWFAGHDRFGRLEMARLLEPATTLARDGYPVSDRLATVLANQGDLIGAWPGLRSLVYPALSPPAEGSLLRMPALARSLAEIATNSDTTIDALWSDYNPDWTSAGQSSAAGDTVYLCAVDADGNAVSLIQSLFGAFGSCVVAENTGILLQNRGAYFSLNPDRVNVLAPGKRTMHTLMPSMMFDGETLLGPIGTQGGDAQAQIQMQLISNIVDYGLEPQAAIEAPRWLAGSDTDDELLVEGGFPEGTIQRLAARGHRVTLIDSWNTGAGHAQMILRDPESGVLRGGADPRADGSAAGY